MSTGAGAGSGGQQVSVVQLSRLHECVLQLRGHLRAVLFDETPQMEMIVFTAFFRLYRDFYADVLRANVAAADATTVMAAQVSSSSSDALSAPPAVTAEMRIVTATYTQDILASCLYLMDVATMPASWDVPAFPPEPSAAQNSENVSAAYVSQAQRAFCCAVFMYLCWSPASLPLKDVLQALYPLLDPGAGCGPQRTRATEATAPQPAENSIAADLFSHPRFANRKRFLSETLSGLVLSRANGVRALLRVLLLDDRVEADMTSEAVQLVVRLLTAPLTCAWLCEGDTAPQLPGPGGATECTESCRRPASRVSITRDTALSVEGQIQRLAPQLVALLEEHAAKDDSTTSKTSPPPFLARLQAQHQRLPPETLEQRLHLFVTACLNTLVRLPPRGSGDFPRCFRQLYYTNRHILTPAFACLSLRQSSVSSPAERDVAAALLRLMALVKGVGLGAGTAALSHVLPATAPGLLNLCALQASPAVASGGRSGGAPSVADCLPRLATLLMLNSTLHELTAIALVQACVSDHSHSFAVPNVVEAALTYSDAACTAATATQGLSWLLARAVGEAPAFAHACVEALVDACQLRLYATGVDTLTTSTASSGEPPSAAAPPVVLLLERLCLESPSEVVFGAHQQLSLVSTLELLRRVVAISPVLHRWAMAMLRAVLTSDTLRHAMAGGGSDSAEEVAQEELQRFLSRLQRCCQATLSTLQAVAVSDSDDSGAAVAAETRAALEACVVATAARLRECSEAGEMSCRAGGQSDASGGNALVVATMSQWQRWLSQLQSALDGRSAVEAAMALTALARSVDDAVHEIAEPEPLQAVVRPLILTLTRVLFASEEMSCVVRAVHCLAWLGMYRFDSADSSFVTDIVWAALGEAEVPPWLATAVGLGKAHTPTTAAQVCRLRARLLDVLLAWCDYDTDSRTLRNIDDALRRTRHTTLFDLLVRLCQSTSDVLVQVAALHLVGAYALAIHPRVPLSALCALCRDVFRLSPHEMAKAACAAALGGVVAALCSSAESAGALLTEVDVEACQSLATAMSSYRSQPTAAPTFAGEAGMHDAVIQQHGRDMLKLLREASQSLLPSDAAATPAVLRVELPSAPPRSVFR